MAAPRMWLVGALVAAVPFAVLSGARPDTQEGANGHPAGEGRSVAASEPTVVSLAKGSKLDTPAVVSDPVVGTLAVWPRGVALEHRVLPPGGVWGPRRALPRGRARGQSSSVVVASDGHGRITAAWVVRTGRGTSWLVSARRFLSGDWSPPQVMYEFVSPYEWNAISVPSLVMGGDGSTVLTWSVELTDPSDEGVRSKRRFHAMYRPAHSDWQALRFPSLQGGGAVADVDDNGVALFATYKDKVSRLVRCNSAECVTDERLPDDWPVGGGIVDVELSADGTTTSVLLSKMVFQGGGSVVFAAHRDASAWSAATRVSPRPRDEAYYDARQVMHDHTTTILVGGWNVCACAIRMQVITRKGGEDYSAPQTLAEGDELEPLGLWSNEEGAALALWQRPVEFEELATASYRPSGDGAWSGPVDLPSAAGGKVVAGAVLADGEGMVLWYDGRRISAWSWPPSMP